MAWYKPGATQNDFSRDKYNCLQQAQQRVAGAQVNPYGGVASNTVVTNEGLYNSCMNANGWYLRSQQSEQQQTQAGANPLKAAIDQINRENQATCDREEYRPLRQKIACSVNDITLEQLSDKSTITASERPLISKYRGETEALNRRRAAAYRSYGGSKGADVALAVERAETLLERSALELYAGTITWGDYNKRRKEVYETYREEFNKAVRR